MNTNPYLIEFYNHYDEDQRLVPKHGSVEFLTTMRYIEKYIRPAIVYWRSEPAQGDIPMHWNAGDILWTG